MDELRPKPSLPDDGYEHFITALGNPKLSLADLQEAAWKYYRKAGCPYGESRKGLALWIERITGTTTN